MSSDQRTSVIPNDLLERIFTNLVNKARRHASSRQFRKKSDAFRSLLRHMPEITYDSTWEAIRPLVATKEEFKALESEEERIAVFDKVIRRLREKRDDERRYREREESTRPSKRDESVHENRRESKGRRRYEDEEYERARETSRHRSRERTHSRDRDDRDRRYRDRSREYSRRDELDYGDDDRRERSSKRRTNDDLRPGDRKVHHFFIIINHSAERKNWIMANERMEKLVRKGKSHIRSYSTQKDPYLDLSKPRIVTISEIPHHYHSHPTMDQKPVRLRCTCMLVR